MKTAVVDKVAYGTTLPGHCPSGCGEDRLIGPHDLWLAATCLAYGLTMVTTNVREFAWVPGLAVESWAGER